MASIQTAIKLGDGMSGPLQGIIKSMNLLISTMSQMQENLEDNEKMSQSTGAAKIALAGAEAELAKAIEDTARAQEVLNQKFSEQPSIPPAPPEPSAPLEPPEPLAPTWETWRSPEIFQTSGVERYSQEVETLQAKMGELAAAQQALDISDTTFLPAGAAEDIGVLQQRLQNLGTMLQKIEKQKDALSSNADPEAFEALNASAEKIRSSIQEAVDQQESLNMAMKDGDLSGIQHAYTKLNQVIDDTELEIRNNTKEQELFNQTVNKGEKAASGLLGKIVGFVGAYAGVKAIKGYFRSANAAASDQIGVEQRLQTIMGNINGMTQDGIEIVKQRARELEKTPIAISASVGMAGQSQLAEYVYDPTNIAGMTEAMYNLATETYGANVSAEQMQQTANLMGKVMMGDINALSRNGFKIDAIFTEAEQKLLKTGTEAERAAMVIEMIDENLSGLAEAMGQTPEGQAIRLANAWGAVQEKIGYGVMPLIAQFTDLLMTNMPMIETVFINVFGTIIDLTMNLLDITTTVVGFMIENWSWLGPVLSGVAVAIGGIVLATKGWAITQGILNAVLNANPIILIITLIAALIVAIVQLWKKNDAFAAGLMRAWNGILNFFDTIPAYFWQLVEWMMVPFKMWASSIGKIYDTVINGIIKGINSVLSLVNKVTGKSFEIGAEFSFENIANSIEDYAAIKKDEAYESAAENAAKREQKVLDMISNREADRAAKEAAKAEKFQAPSLPGAGGLATGAWDVGDGTLPNIDKVKKVGKIEDKVDISSEDLKTMRELAEMKNIQNFVSVKPQLSFGDTHIRKESDLNTLIARITDQLGEEINSSVNSALV